ATLTKQHCPRKDTQVPRLKPQDRKGLGGWATPGRNDRRIIPNRRWRSPEVLPDHRAGRVVKNQSRLAVRDTRIVLRRPVTGRDIRAGSQVCAFGCGRAGADPADQALAVPLPDWVKDA